jgi:hypothetical protein
MIFEVTTAKEYPGENYDLVATKPEALLCVCLQANARELQV